MSFSKTSSLVYSYNILKVSQIPASTFFKNIFLQKRGIFLYRYEDHSITTYRDQLNDLGYPTTKGSWNRYRHCFAILIGCLAFPSMGVQNTLAGKSTMNSTVIVSCYRCLQHSHKQLSSSPAATVTVTFTSFTST